MEIEIGAKYRHFKGNIITVIAIAKHTETLSDLVVYKHDENIWARPVSMFFEDENISDRPDNITGQKYRFEKVEEN